MTMSLFEVIAIMGAHSLGRVMSAGAVNGATGGWIAAQASLSNLYHQMVYSAQAPWIQKGGGGGAGTSSNDVWLTAQTVTVGNVTTKTGIVALRTDAELGINTTNSSGATTCFSPENSGKYAPSMTLQSPSSQARTRLTEPTRYSRLA